MKYTVEPQFHCCHYNGYSVNRKKQFHSNVKTDRSDMIVISVSVAYTQLKWWLTIYTKIITFNNNNIIIIIDNNKHRVNCLDEQYGSSDLIVSNNSTT